MSACVTFLLNALLSEDPHQRQELGDLFQVEHSGVVQLNDGQRVCIIRGTTAIILHPGGRE